MTDSNRMGRTDWGFLLLLSILWGGSFFLTKISLSELPPLTVVFLRVGIASLTLLLYFMLSGRPIVALKPVAGAFIGMGILNNVIPFSLLSWGQVHISSGLASILNAFMPVFTVLLAHFLTQDEKLSVNKMVGIAFGFSGVILMIGFTALEGMSITLLAMIACIAATLSYAFAGIYGKRFAKLGVRPLDVALGQLCMSSLFMAPIVLFVDQPWTLGIPSLGVLGATIALAVFSTAMAYVLFFRVLQAGGATNLSLVTLLIPANAILLGSAILGESLQINDYIGLGLIAMGLLAMDGRVVSFMRSKT